MAKGNSQKSAEGVTNNFAALLWAAAGSLCVALNPDLKGEFVSLWKNLANLPFNLGGWGGHASSPSIR